MLYPDGSVQKKTKKQKKKKNNKQTNKTKQYKILNKTKPNIRNQNKLRNTLKIYKQIHTEIKKPKG